MKRRLNVFAALAMGLVSSVFVPSLKASESDLKTIITISQPVAVTGTVLPAGRYVLKLLNVSAGRDLISILNGSETRVITTLIANHTYRLEPTGKSEFSFYASAAGQPAALHNWFYPGETYGLEFVRRVKKTAAESGVGTR